MVQPTYYAKSPDTEGFQETNQSHLVKTAYWAEQFGAEINRAAEARLCGLLHDFGKYSQRFQNVLKGTASGVDHAVGGATFLYGRSGKKDHPDLVKGLKAKGYAKVEDAYQLIDKQGVQVIVPYQGEEELYQQVSARIRETGMTAELMKLAAPITVSTFDQAMLDLHGEPLPFFSRRHSGKPSGYFLLLTGHEDCYTSDMGLQFREAKPEDYML